MASNTEGQAPPTSEMEDLSVNGIAVGDKAGNDEDIVTPWEVGTSSSKGVDYDKLIREELSLIFFFIFHVKIIIISILIKLNKLIIIVLVLNQIYFHKTCI